LSVGNVEASRHSNGSRRRATAGLLGSKLDSRLNEAFPNEALRFGKLMHNLMKLSMRWAASRGSTQRRAQVQTAQDVP
jgi:hypothetical protein